MSAPADRPPTSFTLIELLGRWSKQEHVRRLRTLVERREEWLCQSRSNNGLGLDDYQDRCDRCTAAAEECDTKLATLCDELRQLNDHIWRNHPDLIGLVPEVPAMTPTDPDVVALVERVKQLAGEVMARAKTPPKATDEKPIAPQLTGEEPKQGDEACDDRKAKINSALALLLTIGPNAAKIARRIGVKRQTLQGWKEFEEQYQKAKSDGCSRRNSMRGSRSGSNDFASNEE